jgi:hypothetical protein
VHELVGHELLSFDALLFEQGCAKVLATLYTVLDIRKAISSHLLLWSHGSSSSYPLIEVGGCRLESRVGTELVEKGLAKAISTKAWHLGKVNLSVSLATHLELGDIKGL